ncbi:MAG: pyridoxal phosphate-dependent aminotransferase [Candidatus Magnetoovum sp. WYHC-5]|nr:pyridoxal phosphate-dependent aminotransferase [Candidatus Magnetoovum sp. WYHC-5]
MISQRAQKIKPSPTLMINDKAKEMTAKGFDVISFAVGEPDFDTPDNIKNAAKKAIDAGFTKYTAVAGIVELKDAVRDKFKKDNNIDYKRSEVVISCGAKHSLYNAAQALLSPGDEVLIPTPYWVSYPDQTLLNDAVPVLVDTLEEDKFLLKPEAIEEKLTNKTKVLILNYPSNPTGSTYDKKSLERLAEVALKGGFYIVSDEVYEKLTYDGLTHISIASIDEEIKKKTVVVNGPSKTYAMTGWRIGYAAGDAKIIDAITNIQSQSTSNPTSISQKACLEALTGPQDFLSQMLVEFDKRRNYIVSALNTIDGIKCLLPEGAFYAFPKISSYFGKKWNHWTINNSFDLAMYLLEDAHIALVPGSDFGKEGFIRISYATSLEKLKEGFSRLKASLAKLV